MISRLRAIRLSASQIAIVAAISALATVLVLRAATPSTLPFATVAALRHAVEVHRLAAPAAADPTAASPATVSAAAPVDDSALSSDGTSSDTSTGDAGSTASDAATTGSDSPAATSPASPATPAAPRLKHVFIIALTTPSFRAVFGPRSPARYLRLTLWRRGTLLTGYRSLGDGELADELAMVSGQAPNADTRAGCGIYAEFASAAKASSSGQMQGSGCVYPNTVLTLGDQVTAAGKAWKAYLDGMGDTTCVHPNSNASDSPPITGAGPEYALDHNPFVYFHSLLDLGDCASDDVDLSELAPDLRSLSRTPNLAYIAPDACADAATASCPAGEPTGLAAEDAFLERWVPRITASPAYRKGGALIIAFVGSRARRGKAFATGALILSPYAKRGATLAGAFTPYSLLRSVEDVFGDTPLVHAQKAPSFALSAFPNAPRGA